MLVLPETLNHAQATSYKASKNDNVSSWLEQAQAANWQIDASKLAQFDSSALALLLDLRRGAMAVGEKLNIHHAPARLTQLAALYGVSDLIA